MEYLLGAGFDYHLALKMATVRGFMECKKATPTKRNGALIQVPIHLGVPLVVILLIHLVVLPLVTIQTE